MCHTLNYAGLGNWSGHQTAQADIRYCAQVVDRWILELVFTTVQGRIKYQRIICGKYK